MAENNLIRFPTERRTGTAAAELVPVASRTAQAEAAPAEPSAAAPATPFAFLSIEIRRLPRGSTWIEGDVAGRILNRCVLAALDVLSRELVPVDLAGTVLRPVVEATFPGPSGALRAATAAMGVRDAVRLVQREMENEFHVVGAITSGATARLDGGVTVTSGSPEQLAARFREHAAPGQVLMAQEAWRSCRDRVEVSEPALPVTVPGGEPVPSYPLTALR